MQKNLLKNLAPRLRELSSGGYSRAYTRKGATYPTSLHLLVVELLDALGVRYETGPANPTATDPDFSLDDKLVFVGRMPSRKDVEALQRAGKEPVVILKEAERSDSLDHGIRVITLEGPVSSRRQTIFLDDPSFNFDYAHILPDTEKCSVMHGHTSSALVEVVGSPKDGMVVDFNDIKPVIRRAIADMDHKLFINEKYVTARTKSHVELAFTTVHGEFLLKVPKRTTVLLQGEATVENLAKELLDRIVSRVPENIDAVGVYVYEGLNKGTHLLAEIHEREAERQRSRRSRQ